MDSNTSRNHSFSFPILKRDLESELGYSEDIVPRFRWFIFSLLFIILLPVSSGDTFLIPKIIGLCILLFFVIRKITKPTDYAIEKEFTGEIIVNSNPFSININGNQIDKSFKGEIIVQFNGYHMESYGHRASRVTYYGTNNKLIIKDKGKKEKTFLFYIGSSEDMKSVWKLTRLLYENKIEFKEYFRGERSYFGKQLKYHEIQELKRRNE